MKKRGRGARPRARAIMRRRVAFTGAILGVTAVFLGAIGAYFYVRSVDAVLAEKFAGRRWDFPSKVYADATLLYPGVDIDAIGLVDRLRRLQYQETATVAKPGQFRRASGRSEGRTPRSVLDLSLGADPLRAVRLTLHDTTIQSIVDLETGERVESIELEPEVLAGLYQDIWEERRVVALSQLPATLINAVLAVEDRTFFEHGGIDPSGVLRALWVNVSHGRIVQGGSTLTQQLMKNFFLTEERTMTRKLREAVMAVRAEQHYSKRQILENYLNEIYLGQNGPQGVFGIWEAARFYFRKHPADLSLAECALIAGLIKAPNGYSPFSQPERALERRNYVLGLMHKNELISSGELEQASAEPLGVASQRRERTDAPYFVDFLRRELAETYPDDVLTREGLSILTALDAEIQRAAERALRQGLERLERDFPRLRDQGQPIQGCLIAINPQTGEIKAMMGGRDYRATQFNRVTQAFRQPGSIFKPFTYVAALDRAPGSGGILPTTVIEDEPFTWEYDGRAWSPQNYKNVFFGQVTVRQALERSLNAATARLAQRVGLRQIRDTAQRMGITSPLPLYPSMVLGAVEVSPLEVAQAYGVLANQGLRATPMAIRSVLDHEGRMIERHPVEISRALDPRVAYLATHLLEGVLDRGTGQGARAAGFLRPAAGKTGTTNDYRDAWFAGFTPDLLAVVWVGFDDNRPMGLTGAQAALPIWAEFMKHATAGYPTRSFSPPSEVRVVAIDPLTGGLAAPGCRDTIEEAFFAGEEPTRPCPLHAPLATGTGHSETGRLHLARAAAGR